MAGGRAGGRAAGGHVDGRVDVRATERATAGRTGGRVGWWTDGRAEGTPKLFCVHVTTVLGGTSPTLDAGSPRWKMYFDGQTRGIRGVYGGNFRVSAARVPRRGAGGAVARANCNGRSLITAA